MKLGEFPYVRTHYDYKDGNYSSSHGFRSGQSDVVIILNKYFYYEIYGKKNLTAFFGGSTTFGIGSTDKGTFPEEYKKITNENVINFGLGGNNQEGQISLLNYFLKQGYKFNKIIFLDGLNEDGCFFYGRKSINHYINHISTTNNSNYYAKQFFIEFLPNKISKVFSKKKNIERQVSEWGEVVGDENLNEARFEFCANQYIKNLIYLDSISKSNSIKTYVILQPALEIINSTKKLKNYERFYNLIINKHNKIKLLLTNTNLVDLRNSSKEEYFLDSQHLNDYGNAFLAKEFIKLIKQN